MSKGRKQISFEINEETAELIEKLRKDFNVSTNAQVLRRALTLAKYAARNADEDHSIVIESKDGTKERIFLAG
ncbi:MAG: hypothetical protein VX464_22255 [Pseudomonadota bacterium]|nr:hypothetical protein [Pseudomonadota bacterium]